MQPSTKKRGLPSRPALRREDLIALVPPFEERMARDSGWALSEGSKFFEGTGAVKETLKKIAKRLGELQIPYAVVGGMALSMHGFPRFTVDVDILVTADGLKEIHRQLDGLGYLPPFTHSKNLRDTETGVKIEFLITGGFPGDGKPKPVAFPDPATVAVEGEGIQYINLPTLVELKIASGMTNTARLKDLSDAQELIKALNLPRDFAEKLNPFVREKYDELWRGARQPELRYFTTLRNPFLTNDTTDLDELIADIDDTLATLKAMRVDGVTLNPLLKTGDDEIYLVTTDPDIARKYGMHDESEFNDKREGDQSSQSP